MNAWLPIAQLVFAGVVAAATVIYVIETVRMRRLLADPCVVVTQDGRTLRFRNVGKGVAYWVETRCHTPVPETIRSHFDREIVAMLAPGEEWDVSIDTRVNKDYRFGMSVRCRAKRFAYSPEGKPIASGRTIESDFVVSISPAFDE